MAILNGLVVKDTKENGKTIRTYSTYKNDVLNGPFKIVELGNPEIVLEESNYVNGLLEGKSTTFHDELLIVTEYTKGLRNGITKKFKDGYLVTDIMYVNGVKEGHTHVYYKDGPTTTIMYHEGEIDGDTVTVLEGKVISVIGYYRNKIYKIELLKNGERIYYYDTDLGFKMVNGKKEFGKIGEIDDETEEFLVNLYRTAREEESEEILEQAYLRGLPVPTEHHESTKLLVNPRRKGFFQKLSIPRELHYEEINMAPQELKDILNAWIYGDYTDLNRYINDINSGTKTPSFDFVNWAKNPKLANMDGYALFRSFIMNIKPSEKKIFAWRGVYGTEPFCNFIPDSVLIFNRVTACSVAMEVSCEFASGGTLFLVEIPAGSHYVNLTSIKKSEPEFLLPDRSVFLVKQPIVNKFCGTECEEIIHIKLIGYAAEYPVIPKTPSEIVYEKVLESVKSDKLYFV